MKAFWFFHLPLNACLSQSAFSAWCGFASHSQQTFYSSIFIVEWNTKDKINDAVVAAANGYLKATCLSSCCCFCFFPRFKVLDCSIYFAGCKSVIRYLTEILINAYTTMEANQALGP